MGMIYTLNKKSLHSYEKGRDGFPLQGLALDKLWNKLILAIHHYYKKILIFAARM